MEQERIEILVDGRTQLFDPGTHLLSSAGTGWEGFLLEAHRISGAGRLKRVSQRHNLVVLCTAGWATVEVCAGGAEHRMIVTAGNLCLLGGGYELECLAWSGTHEIVVVRVCPQRLGRLLKQDGNLIDLALTPQFVVSDIPLQNLINDMRREISAGCRSGSLYGESMCLALATYLSSRYSKNRSGVLDSRARLSLAQLERVKAYIRANLTTDLRLADLAAAAQLSPHHFSHLFKNTVGMSPHRYVVLERIGQSKRLLRNGANSISDIAMMSGFANQSHFTDVFRRITGVTPRRYQRHA